MFDDATQSPFPDFLGAGLSLVRCPSAINAVRLSDCEVCRNHMRRIQENAGAGASDLQAYIHQHLRDDGTCVCDSPTPKDFRLILLRFTQICTFWESCSGKRVLFVCLAVVARGPIKFSSQVLNIRAGALTDIFH